MSLGELGQPEFADDLEDEILDRAGGLVVGHEVLGRKRRD
jgi:hypothetical protein